MTFWRCLEVLKVFGISGGVQMFWKCLGCSGGFWCWNILDVFWKCGEMFGCSGGVQGVLEFGVLHVLEVFWPL